MKKPAFGPVFYWVRALRIFRVPSPAGIDRKQAATEAEPDKRDAHAVHGMQPAASAPCQCRQRGGHFAASSIQLPASA
ncbi:hypothetical protein [Burkholderia pyrrocinia]|uniref:hypothetical protein n=1 Tax=Burkholderia pyrrocinia TaxID=60550 RepID=UPI00190F6988|nr:hypothetical protein [Burkholderia pyrrocinia]